MDEIKEYGQTDLNNNSRHKKIHLLNIIGEIEGHEMWHQEPRQLNMNTCFLS